MSEDFVAWHNIDSPTLQTNFDKYYAQGYRFVSLSIYGTTNAPLFAAVMVRRTNIILQYVRWGLNSADYQKAFNSYAAEGYGQRIISVTGMANQPLLAGVWEPMSAHGWDFCMAKPNGGWYAQKGGSWVDAQSCVRFHGQNQSDDICMAVAWAHSVTAGDWYPDFPEVTQPAITQDWGTTDLFPTLGMPSLQ
jgi:hypothetical protein